MLVIEETIGGIDLGAAVATGGELQGGLAAHGVQDRLEAILEPPIDRLGLAGFGRAGFGRAGLGLGGAEAGGCDLLLDPILHGAVRVCSPSNVLSGLCEMPGVFIINTTYSFFKAYYCCLLCLWLPF
jgi:hypothetical protein